MFLLIGKGRLYSAIFEYTYTISITIAGGRTHPPLLSLIPISYNTLCLSLGQAALADY